MKVSIITISYNYAHFMGECLESVAAQTFRDFEQIVIDPGSADDPEEIAAKFSKTRFIKTEYCGLSTCRNQAIEQAQGEFIVNLDADDKIRHTFLEKLVEKAAAGKIICPGMQEFGDRHLSGCYLNHFDYADFAKGNRIFCASMFAKEDWRRVGGYDTALDFLGCEDWEFWTTLVGSGCKVVPVPALLFWYRVHGHSNGHRWQAQNKQAGEYIRRKHGGNG